MEIWIPSLARPGHAAALVDSIPERWRPHIRIACDADDVHLESYKRQMPVGVRVHAFKEKGIAKVRQAIGESCESSTFLMLDDDITFFRRERSDSWSLVKATQDDVGRMLDEVWRHLMGDYCAVGIAPRQGFNTRSYKNEENTRIIRTLGFKKKDFLECEHGRVEVMEDFDILLQLLKKGHPNLLLTGYAQDQTMTNMAGGCSTYRTHAVHDAAAHKLAELHGGYVRLRQKVNKTGGAFGTRTEVTIFWKKAFNHHVRVHATGNAA